MNLRIKFYFTDNQLLTGISINKYQKHSPENSNFYFRTC